MTHLNISTLSKYVLSGHHKSTLLHLYRLLIRSKMDYGSIVYNSASNTTLKSLDIIVQDNLRNISGCFRSTPVQSLYVLLNEMPLEKRRKGMTLKYYVKIRSHISNPAHSSLILPNNHLMYNRKRLTPPLSIRINNYCKQYNVIKPVIQNDFSYTLLNIKTSSYQISFPTVDVHLTLRKKSDTQPSEFSYIFKEHIKKNYGAYDLYYYYYYSECSHIYREPKYWYFNHYRSYRTELLKVSLIRVYISSLSH